MKKTALAGCIIIENNKILLINRRKTGWYELPGGKIEDGESPEQAATRELKEELSCDIKIINKFGEKEFEHNGSVMDYHWFTASIEAGQSPKIGEPDKFSHFKYIPIQDLSKTKLSPNMQNLAGILK